MADHQGMDPARIARLRSPERLAYFDPEKIWDELKPAADCTMLDIGTGVGFISLPFAKRFPNATVYACDIQEGMIALQREDAAAKGIGNVTGVVMKPNAVDLPEDSADLILMAQLHHELDAPEPLLAECKRLLRPGGTVAIVDWKDEENGKSPAAGRRVPVATMRAQLEGAGFTEIQEHDVYEFHTFMTGRA